MVKQLEKQINRLSISRLFCFVAAIIFIVSGVNEKNILLMILALIACLLFLYLIQKQSKLVTKLQREKIREELEETICLRQTDNWKSQQHYNYSDKYYISDLDVIGQDSLFHYLSFHLCDHALIQRLTTPIKTEENILKMQSVFQELAEGTFIKEFLITAKLHQLKKVIPQTIVPMKKYKKICLYIYPFTTLALFILKVKWLILWMICGILISMIWAQKWQNEFAYVDVQTKQVLSMTSQIETLKRFDFNNVLFKDYQNQLASYVLFKKRIVFQNQLIHIRRNPFIVNFLNALCLYDGWLYHYLEKNPIDVETLNQMQTILEDITAICQMSLWNQIKKDTIYPIISENLEAKDMKHPLMDTTKAVGATFTFNHEPVIITGSNMSGKTTFMRNLGLNLVLMYCGLSVDASYFSAPILDIYTSMRVSDRMQEGVSTFYGELLRIKNMVQQSHRTNIYFIDEIFKGTNLKDRIVGAKAVIEKLASDKSYLFISTHDEQLCYHENVPLRLVHFQESYQGDEIYFDYLIKEGMCETSNAKFLMKMTGILE